LCQGIKFVGSKGGSAIMLFVLKARLLRSWIAVRSFPKSIKALVEAVAVLVDESWRIHVTRIHEIQLLPLLISLTLMVLVYRFHQPNRHRHLTVNVVFRFTLVVRPNPNTCQCFAIKSFGDRKMHRLNICHFNRSKPYTEHNTDH
jgi:hypothetical protein